MITSIPLIIVCIIFTFLLTNFPPSSSSNSSLHLDFYQLSCPSLQRIVQSTVAYYTSLDPTTPAPLLRLFFHDCFVQGCDASVLVNSTTKNAGEKDAAINFSIGNFFVLDDIKERLEKECPDTVSCADIVALAAVYSIQQAGGPLYPIELGRRDSLTSYASSAQVFLPAFNLTADGLLENFRNVGLDETDLVALSGSHTIGQGHCQSISNRLFPDIDAQYHMNYGKQLLVNCTLDGRLKAPSFDNDTQMFNDPITPLVFDNQYYRNLKLAYGLFTSDVSLYNDARTRHLVELYAEDEAAFFYQFGVSLRKMGKIGILSGTQGQIRKECWVRNSNNADFAFNPDSFHFISS